MNQAILIGRLTADPEVRTTGSGIVYARFSLAVDRRYRDANGNKQTDFINVVAWRKTGELCGQYLSKGRQCCVVGEIQTRSYDGQDGIKRYVTEVIANEVEFLGGSRRDGVADSSSAPENNVDTGAEASNTTAGTSVIPNGFKEVTDDELPF